MKKKIDNQIVKKASKKEKKKKYLIPNPWEGLLTKPSPNAGFGTGFKKDTTSSPSQFDFSGFSTEEKRAIKKWLKYREKINKPYKDFKQIRGICIRLSAIDQLIPNIENNIAKNIDNLNYPKMKEMEIQEFKNNVKIASLDKKIGEVKCEVIAPESELSSPEQSSSPTPMIKAVNGLDPALLKKGTFDFSGFDVLQISAIKEWLEYKRLDGFSYNQDGMTSLRNTCLDLAKKNILLPSIEDSIASGYGAIFAHTPKQIEKRECFVEQRRKKERREKVGTWVKIKDSDGNQVIINADEIYSIHLNERSVVTIGITHSYICFPTHEEAEKVRDKILELKGVNKEDIVDLNPQIT